MPQITALGSIIRFRDLYVRIALPFGKSLLNFDKSLPTGKSIFRERREETEKALVFTLQNN